MTSSLSITASNLSITTLYAGILGIAFALANARVMIARLATNKFYGADENSKLQHLSRSAGTISDYSAIGLLLLALLEYNSVLSAAPLWWWGFTFTVARILHAIQLGSPDTVPLVFRAGPFLTTLAYLVISSLLLVFNRK